MRGNITRYRYITLNINTCGHKKALSGENEPPRVVLTYSTPESETTSPWLLPDLSASSLAIGQ